MATDPRRLWFEAVSDGERKPVRCRLPARMLPKASRDPSVFEFAPGEQVFRTFDPRFLCFGKEQRAALEPNTELVPVFGWPEATKTAGQGERRVGGKLAGETPFLARPIAARSSWAPRKNVTGAPITLGDAYRRWLSPPEEKDRDRPLRVSITGDIDARNERSVVATLEFANASEQKLVFFLRRELVTFEVLGPAGLTLCRALPDRRFPQKRSFTTIRAGKSVRVSSRLVELCPRGTFSRAGTYLLGARFDATVDGRNPKLEAFTGVVHTERPVLVRVQTSQRLFRPTPREAYERSKQRQRHLEKHKKRKSKKRSRKKRRRKKRSRKKR